MKEDIKILEELKEHFIFNTSGFLSKTREEQKRTAYAIENLIKAYRELQAKIDVSNWHEKTCREIIDSKYILKSKIKEKIEELEEKKSKEPIASVREYSYHETINILQELMEDK